MASASSVGRWQSPIWQGSRENGSVTLSTTMFFSSRRRHTRWNCDWSSDVCSSDLGSHDWGGVSPVTPDHVNPERPWPALERLRAATESVGKVLRSEERRVGKERSSLRGVRGHRKAPGVGDGLGQLRRQVAVADLAGQPRERIGDVEHDDVFFKQKTAYEVEL